jgi:hypothetical protein
VQRRDKTTDGLDIKNRLAEICNLASQTGTISAGGRGSQDRWGNWESNANTGGGVAGGKPMVRIF